MKVMLDFDDVTFGFNRGFFPWLERTHGLKLRFEDVRNFHYHTILGISPDRLIELFDEFVLGDGHQELRPVEGAIEILEALSQDGYEFVMCSSRPQKYRDPTFELIERYCSGINISKTFLLGCHDGGNEERLTKLCVCEREGLTWAIDDAPHNATDLARGGISTLMLDRLWNQHCAQHKNIYRVFSWGEIYSLITS